MARSLTFGSLLRVARTVLQFVYNRRPAEMTIRRVATFSLLLAAAACAPAARNARTQIAPKDGPNVSLYATYSGGLFDRNVYANFNVDRPAYVMIAHLSGEGVIEVLYPRNARDTAK